MSRPVARLAIETDHELLSGYADFCATLGVTDRALRDRLRSARAFLGTHPDVDAWLARPLPTRLADLRRIRAWPLLSYLASRARSASTSTCSWPRTRAASG